MELMMNYIKNIDFFQKSIFGQLLALITVTVICLILFYLIQVKPYERKISENKNIINGLKQESATIEEKYNLLANQHQIEKKEQQPPDKVLIHFLHGSLNQHGVTLIFKKDKASGDIWNINIDTNYKHLVKFYVQLFNLPIALKMKSFKVNRNPSGQQMLSAELTIQVLR